MEPFTSVCFQILDVDTDSCISSWDCSWFTNMAHFQRFPCGSSSHNDSYSTRQGSKYIYPKYTRTWRLGKEPQGGTHCETDFGQNSIHHLVSTDPVYTEGHNGIQGSLESFSVQSFYPTVLKNSGYVYCIYLWQQGFSSKRPGLPPHCALDLYINLDLGPWFSHCNRLQQPSVYQLAFLFWVVQVK